MNKVKTSLLAVITATTVLGSTIALAHPYYHGGGYRRSHVDFGIVIGGPGYWYPPSYYYPGYYYPPAVVMPAPAAPPTYIEQNPAPAATDNYWYYCAGSNTYYPYVKACPGGWQRVAPQPPNP